MRLFSRPKQSNEKCELQLKRSPCGETEEGMPALDDSKTMNSGLFNVQPRLYFKGALHKSPLSLSLSDRQTNTRGHIIHWILILPHDNRTCPRGSQPTSSPRKPVWLFISISIFACTSREKLNYKYWNGISGNERFQVFEFNYSGVPTGGGVKIAAKLGLYDKNKNGLVLYNNFNKT